MLICCLVKTDKVPFGTYQWRKGTNFIEEPVKQKTVEEKEIMGPCCSLEAAEEQQFVVLSDHFPESKSTLRHYTYCFHFQHGACDLAPVHTGI